MHTRFIIVLGSLMSGLGKGVLTASILRILKFYGYKALPIKFDGYLNFDCGTMNPYRHGEVFVLDDKSEVDMDFGTYERFMNFSLTKDSSITGGKLMSKIIAKERQGDFLGEDVQVVPHLTNEIIDEVTAFGEKNKLDFVVIEVGGTVGDLENGYFIEAMRQLSLKKECIFVDLTYIPELSAVGEQKTKPSQSAIKLLLSLGIRPDFIVCRGNKPINEKTRDKLSLYSNLPKERIIDDSDLSSVYEVPLYLMSQNFDKLLLKSFNIKSQKINLDEVRKWRDIVNRIKSAKRTVNISIVGKYITLKDSYASVKEAIMHASAYLKVKPNINWIESEIFERESPKKYLKNSDLLIVPGGFGSRGIEGMINAIEYARKHDIPYLGLCLGMQLMTIEYARNVCNLKGANSTEFNEKTRYNVIDLIPSQRGLRQKGGTMRLGAYEMKILYKDSIVYRAYRKEVVSERHRHRYEFNNDFKDILEKNGLRISATTLDGSLVEAVEWKNGKGVGVQSHPEFKSRLNAPSPLFIYMLKLALKK